MKHMEKAIIFAPFWRHPGHVGNYRVDRFVRWLTTDSFYVVLVRAGSVAGQCTKKWGMELTIKDPLGLYRDAVQDDIPIRTRRPNKLRRWLAYFLFNPDPGIVWARAAARSPSVLMEAAGATFVISSNPPESAHIGAAILAKQIKSKLIIDMRDGWLDEPLKQLLRDSSLRRWREGKLENGILQQANQIFVTSPAWKSLLVDRLPFTRDKTVVMTNCYPPEGMFKLKPSKNNAMHEPLRLVHAGRFTGSMLTRKVSLLLEPLLCGFDKSTPNGVITLLGRLEQTDLAEIETWRVHFASRGWKIEVKASVPRDEMMDLLCRADGLLLLAEKQAAIPVKLYEYLLVRKPVFVVTSKGSAVWTIGEELPQLFLTDYTMPDKDVVRSFISASKIAKNNYKVPRQFDEEVLKKTFIENLVTV